MWHVIGVRFMGEDDSDGVYEVLGAVVIEI
jgi:hypothetical protein